MSRALVRPVRSGEAPFANGDASEAAQQERAIALLGQFGLVEAPPIYIDLPVFSGPLLLLFAAVRDASADLMEVPLGPICESYLEYLRSRPSDEDEDATTIARSHRLDDSIAAVAMLAYLLERKAWLLRPQPEPEPDEYEEASDYEFEGTADLSDIVAELADRYAGRADLFFRSPDPAEQPYEPPIDLRGIGPADLGRMLERVLRAAKPRTPQILSKARPSLEETMERMIDRLDKTPRGLVSLLTPPDDPEAGFTREEAVFGFLAILELVRLRRARLVLFEDEILFIRA